MQKYTRKQILQNTTCELFPLYILLNKSSAYCRQLMETNKKTTPSGYDPQTTVYYKDNIVERCVRFAIILVGLFMLITPQWWLLFVENKTYHLGIITGFIALFLALLSTVSGARPFESLAGTAAYVYCAFDNPISVPGGIWLTLFVPLQLFCRSYGLYDIWKVKNSSCQIELSR